MAPVPTAVSAAGRAPRLGRVSVISELLPDTSIEGVYAVARKQRLHTRSGTPYLALELIDASGRIDARVWSDVELLDRRFQAGDAVRVLGRVERFRDRLQLEVRTLEPVPDVDPATLAPEPRRDPEELAGFLEFLTAEIAHPQLRGVVQRTLADELLRRRLAVLPATLEGHHSYAGGLLEHTVGVASICHETAQLHARLRADLLLAAALLHDLGRTVELGPPPLYPPTVEGRLLGHVQLGLRLVEARARDLTPELRAELLHAVAVHHEARAARTAEAAVLYHANQLDAVAATRPVAVE
jgi:3'-5' exoribonuclease